MMGHHGVWDYPWSLFILALDEAAKWFNPPESKVSHNE
jgi:hypothetical protein